MASLAAYSRFPRRPFYIYLIIFLTMLSSLVLLLILFPGSSYIVVIIPLLAQLGILVMTLSQSSDLGVEGQTAIHLQNLGKKLRTIVLVAIALTGFSISLLNWGTIPATLAFICTTIFAIYYMSKESLRRMRINQIKEKGYTFSNYDWRIEVDRIGDENIQYLSWKGTKAPLIQSEIPLVYELEELNRQGRIRNFYTILKRIHALRTNFLKDEWKISPSGQTGIYMMYKTDLTNLVTISKRDAAWLIRSTMNKPEQLLIKIQQITPQINTYKHLTRHLKNVTYAGNHAVISTSNGYIYVDLHNSKVYKDDEWGKEDSGFVCIVPLHEYAKEEWHPVVQYGFEVEEGHFLTWHDGVTLSKIFNIARETFQVKDLLR
ncbi:MAG: hypothetical protein JSW01_05400 [Candidatus Bathyarchaeota archaeon]|nr:MAG: hypothetical protein JSW01_05400 [Candidatus Bathyarchaeota archaeon]